MTTLQEIGVGFEIPSVRKSPALYHTRLYSGFPNGLDQPMNKSFHTDDALGHAATGADGAVIQGALSATYFTDLLCRFFGESFVREGEFSVRFLKNIVRGDQIITRGVVREIIPEASGTRLRLEVWCENQRGEQVTLGTASGVLRS